MLDRIVGEMESFGGGRVKVKLGLKVFLICKSLIHISDRFSIDQDEVVFTSAKYNRFAL